MKYWYVQHHRMSNVIITKTERQFTMHIYLDTEEYMFSASAAVFIEYTNSDFYVTYFASNELTYTKVI